MYMIILGKGLPLSAVHDRTHAYSNAAASNPGKKLTGAALVVHRVYDTRATRSIRIMLSYVSTSSDEMR